jgi:hypothetical protein
MRRREFIVGFCIATAWPLAVRAQPKMYRIGFLTRETDASVSTQIDAFRQHLRELDGLKERALASCIGMQRVNSTVFAPSLVSLSL